MPLTAAEQTLANMQELWATKRQSAMENLGVRAGGDHLVSTTGRRKDGPSPRPSPIGWERGKAHWQQGRSRPLTHALSPSPLTHALSPSAGEREKRDAATFARPAGNHDSELEVFELAQAQLNGKPADEQRQRREA